jgi:hypothetical protein
MLSRTLLILRYIPHRILYDAFFATEACFAWNASKLFNRSVNVGWE